MLPSIIDAYSKENYVFDLGSPALLWTGLAPRQEWRPRWRYESPSHRQIAISLRDAWYFRLIADALNAANNPAMNEPQSRSLVIGNSFGISTMLIAELMKPAKVDAIDAETSNGSTEGTQLTRRVAKRLNLDVQITKGFSPQDLPSACRSEKYALIFVDGEHTNEQIVKDFQAIADRLNDRCVVFFHDVGLRDMDEGWAKVRQLAKPLGLVGYDLHATDSGSTLLVRNLPALENMLKQSAPGLRAFNDTYHAGIALPMPPLRPDTDLLVVRDDDKIALLGAGNDLKHYAHFILSHPNTIEAIYDDDPSKLGPHPLGVEVRHTDELKSTKADAIVISTHKYADQARAKINQLAPQLNLRTYPRQGLAVPTRIVKTPERDPTPGE